MKEYVDHEIEEIYWVREGVLKNYWWNRSWDLKVIDESTCNWCWIC